MIIQLPKDEVEEKRMINYLNSAKIPYEEVTENDL